MTDYVTVYCNVPMGYRLPLHTISEETEPVLGGGARTYKISRPTGDVVVLNGTSALHGQARKDKDGNFVLMINGYGATPNVDKDHWDRWVRENQGHPMLAGPHPALFARGKALDAQAMAKDMTGARSGLEPLTPTLQDGAGRITQTDPRAPRQVVRHDGERAA